MSSAYVDASALVKLFKPERESERLAVVLAGHETLVSAEIVVVEALCTARRLGGQAMFDAAQEEVSRLELVPLSAGLRDRAVAPFARQLRSLDAIHAATALSVARATDVAVVYDLDLAAALSAEGLPVTSPGAT